MRYHEANYAHMFSIANIIPCMSNLKRTKSIEVTYDEIQKCDELAVKAVKECFIKKYHHFVYDGPGRLKCKYVKGRGEYMTHQIKRAGMLLDVNPRLLSC